MPSKSRRAASRQTQMKRKRRSKPRTQEFDAGPAESSRIAAMDEEPEDDVTETAAVVATQTQPSRSVARSARRSRRQITSETPLTYPHLGSELRRIGVITVLIAIALTVLTFVLGG